MGEIADMMLDGTLCAGCGVYMEGDAGGFPRYCSIACGGSEYADRQAPPPPRADKTNCGACGKRVKKTGLRDHMRDVHHITWGESPPK